MKFFILRNVSNFPRRRLTVEDSSDWKPSLFNYAKALAILKIICFNDRNIHSNRRVLYRETLRRHKSNLEWNFLACNLLLLHVIMIERIAYSNIPDNVLTCRNICCNDFVDNTWNGKRRSSVGQRHCTGKKEPIIIIHLQIVNLGRKTHEYLLT